jgi:CRP-like cAMP-binding protein
MPLHFEIFNQFLRKYVEFTDAELTDFNNKCSSVAFSKGALVMKAGQVQKNLYFITEGIVKNFIELDNGDHKIHNFRMEHMTVTGYAFYNYADKLKALVNVDCLEDCVLIQVPIEAINYVINHVKLGDRLGRYLAEAHIIQMLEYVLERDTKSVIDRLDKLDQNFPNIHQRVPQYMIASYLGITPVHLSNLKKKRKLTKK